MQKQQISLADFLVLIKTVGIGVISGELYILIESSGKNVVNFLVKYSSQIIAQSYINSIYEQVIIAGIFGLTVLWCSYIFISSIFSSRLIKRFWLIIKSLRIDLGIYFITGVIFSYFFSLEKIIKLIGLEDFYKKITNFLTLETNFFLIIIVLTFVFVLLTKLKISDFLISRKDNNISSFFIHDKEKEDLSEDLLNIKNKVINFAEKVFNQGLNKDSLVFGLDAPWGTGKSTFIKMCIKYWHKKYKNKLIVFRFSPINYPNQTNLIEVFIDGLVKAIQEDYFIPEIRPIVSKYSRLARETSRWPLSILKVNNSNFQFDSILNDVVSDLVVAISRLPRKIVVVIDDLDRITYSEIQNVLFMVRKSFLLPNVNYIICYDSSSLGFSETALENSKIVESLEKFVNIKFNLYHSKEELIKFIDENLKEALKGSVSDREFVYGAIGGLKDLFLSPEYLEYAPFIGDLRKLKRIINTTVMLGLTANNYDKTDINAYDFVHLLLIYIYFPDVFQKIYHTELGDSRGTFSAVANDDHYYKKPAKTGNSDQDFHDLFHYRSSIYFGENFTGARLFLLNKIFNVEERYGKISDKQQKDKIVRTFACFNGVVGTGKNLQDYLKLIVDAKMPSMSDQYNYYLSWADKILKYGIDEDSFEDKEVFDYKKGVESWRSAWRVLLNSIFQVSSSKVGEGIITHLINNLDKYPAIDIQNMDLRHDLATYLARLINDIGWVDKEERYHNNNSENIIKINEWVFGEKGIINTLAEKKRGILGFYDLLVFRIRCNAVRGGDIYNLTRALYLYQDPFLSTDGISTQNLTIKGMRILSQQVFSIFEKNYIKQKINIFDEVMNLSANKLSGKFHPYLKDLYLGQAQELNQNLFYNKYKLLSFIIFQLGQKTIESHGVGCGYYGPSGDQDNKEIHLLVNKYLFDICFNPAPGVGKKDKNLKYFLDFMLIRSIRSFTSHSGGESVSRTEFGKSELLDSSINSDLLKEFWQKNSKKIKKIGKTRRIILNIGGLKVPYAKYLQDLYKTLDDLLNPQD